VSFGVSEHGVEDAVSDGRRVETPEVARGRFDARPFEERLRTGPGLGDTVSKQGNAITRSRLTYPSPIDGGR
jgi:hypothetical protein